ncbi:MAG: MBL fold metallo-hydrolase [Anaerolineae bacterium]|jgi:glyoxylase-like metal-dependent hydrolase (beta-lactamase superfamily II)|nr:MBL fold metallo-hydrolase [Anaerolineae bacterium]
MQVERISENVYWFQSEVYAQVTAGVIVGPQWAVVVDTLAMPEETLELRRYIEEDLRLPVRYIINTHHHADHSWGNCFFPGTTVIAHELCRQQMEARGFSALEAAAAHDPQFKQTKLILPHLTLSSGNLVLQVGKKHLTIFPTPGHSPDGISVLIEEDRVLFAGDVFLPVPFIVDGDITQMRETLRLIGTISLENVVQGHGDVILRGEILDAIEDNLAYLEKIEAVVNKTITEGKPQDSLQKVQIDSCGKSRIFLNGIAEQLHQSNLRSLYQKAKKKNQ